MNIKENIYDKKRKALRAKKHESVSRVPKKSLSEGGDVGGSHNARAFSS